MSKLSVIAADEAHHTLTKLGQLLHQRMRELADVQSRQHGAGQAQRRGAETVFGAFLDVDQISEVGERMCEPRHRRFSQTAALAEFLIAEHAIAVAKAGQYLESARQCGHKMTVAFDHSRLGRRLRPSDGLSL